MNLTARVDVSPQTGPQISPEISPPNSPGSNPAPSPETAIDVRSGTALPISRERQAVPVDRLVLAHDPYHPRSEEIRSLRTELLLRHEAGDSANIFAVLSPGAREGRSHLAAELAIAFAQLGRPTLLVDADLRHPQQHMLFNTGNLRGLAQALSQEQRPLLHSVAGLPALFLLTAGPPPHNALELLSDRGFETMVQEWQQNFAFVVLDTPPVSRYADGLAVATIVGRVLSLSHARHTTYKDTRNMLRRLAATRSRVLGAVINNF
jgi:protein-tyrosine kinase